MANDRDEEGRFRERYPDEMFIEAVQSLTVASTQNVADNVDCSYDLAYRRLEELEDEGRIVSQIVGNAFVWVLV